MKITHIRRMFSLAALSIVVSAAIPNQTIAAAQEASYFALQQAGQGNVAIDKTKKIAYITDLGKSGDGDRVTVDGVPLLESLISQKIETLVFTCSHPHSDHSGGIRALLSNPQTFFADSERKVPLFRSVVIVENQMVDSLFSTLQETVGINSGIHIARIDATDKNAFAAISSTEDAIYIESIPYKPAEKAGVHGRSIVTRFVLGHKYSNVDFDDASSDVIRQTVTALRERGASSIDSFVVPHHGSAYHDIEPILALAPKAAIIAVNPRNPYGHPAPSILLALMDRLGPEHVFFTGSADHVVLGPDGIIRGAYTAANAESFALFVKPSYERIRNNPAALAAYKELESRMVNQPAVDSAKTDKDELAVEIETAESDNEELLLLTDRLSRSTTSSPAIRKQFDDICQKQMDRLALLEQRLQRYEKVNAADLSDEQARIKRMILTLRPNDDGSESPSSFKPRESNNDDGTLAQALALGLQNLLSSVSEPALTTREVKHARYLTSSTELEFGDPEVEVWTGHPVEVPPQIKKTYSEMESSLDTEDRPGGIAIGNVARPDKGLTLSDYVLTFDPSKNTLALRALGHQEIVFEDEIEPRILKALYRFAVSNRIAVVSMGGGDTSTVRLDPALVDTEVGTDMIAADLVGPDLYVYDFFHSDDKLAERLEAATRELRPCIGLTSTTATWFDNPITIATNGTKLSLSGHMRLEFLTKATRPEEWRCKDMKCGPITSVGNSDESTRMCHLISYEQFVEANYADIEARFPSVSRLTEYARIIDFLRWARQPGHVTAINLLPLADVPASRPPYRTPDIVRDDRH